LTTSKSLNKSAMDQDNNLNKINTALKRKIKKQHTYWKSKQTTLC